MDADVVPHMGWDEVQVPQGSKLMDGVEDQRFYFVHSYAAMVAQGGGDGREAGPDLSLLGPVSGRDRKDGERMEPSGIAPAPLVTWAGYGRSRFVAAYECGPLSATQFHPEKSAMAGARLLTNWVRTLSGNSAPAPEKGE